MSRSTSADSGEPDDAGRGDAASDRAEESEPQADAVDEAAEGEPQTDADDSAADDAAADQAATDAEDQDASQADDDQPGDAEREAEAGGSKGKKEVASATTRSRSASGARSVRSARATSSGRTTSVRAAEAGKGRATVSRAEAEAGRQPRPNLFARILRFVREVIAELRKVVTPTRNELFTYSAVVVVFLIIMMAYVGVLDYGVGRLVLWAFGG